MADERTRLPVKIVDPTTAANQAAVTAAGEVRTILGANTGVDIGDVDVTSVVPLTGATNLGKAESAVHASGDVGVLALAVRDDTPIGLAADGQYIPMTTDSLGRLHIAVAPANDGVDIGDVDVTSVIPLTGATNLGKAVDSVGGATDTGVAVLALRDDALTTLTPIDGDYVRLRVNSTGALHVTGGGGGVQFAVDDALGATPTGTLALARRDDVLSALTPVADDAIALRVDANGALWTHDDILDIAISGSELQVDVVAPLPTGTNTIGDIANITTTVTPGTAAANLGKAIDSVVGATDTGVAILAERIDTPAAITPAIGDYSGLFVDVNGRLHVTDPNAGAGVPGTPVNVEANSTNTAPDGTFDVDSADFGADTKRVAYATAGSSVNFKAELNFVDDGTPTTLATGFAQGPGQVVLRPGHKDFWAHTFAANAGFDGFRLTITNLDTSESADLYGTINHED